MPAVTQPATSARIRGYSLVEMVIAMVLVAALMSSVWSIMSLYNGLLTAGRDRTTEQQLIRSLFQIVCDDITGVNVATGAGNMPEFGDTLGVPAFDDGSPFDAVQGLSQTSELKSGSLSVTGSATAMRLRIRSLRPAERRTPSDIDLLNELGGGSAGRRQQEGRVTEFQTIVYQIMPWGSSRAVDSGNEPATPGLYRIQVDTQLLDTLESNASSAELVRQDNPIEVTRQNLMMLRDGVFEDAAPGISRESLDAPPASGAEIDTVPEVVNCRFEYFDGSTWRPSWSDDHVRRLPAAIRVSFDIVSQKELGRVQDLYQPPHAVDADGLTTVPDVAASDQESQPIAATRYSRTILVDPSSPAKPGDRL
jgi:prepilin-type N-terminal cleavage/methylation domain-containing protein